MNHTIPFKLVTRCRLYPLLLLVAVLWAGAKDTLAQDVIMGPGDVLAGTPQPGYQGTVQLIQHPDDTYDAEFTPTGGEPFFVKVVDYDTTAYWKMLYEFRDEHGYHITRKTDGRPDGQGDASTFTPVAAIVTALNHDWDSTWVYMNALVNSSFESNGKPIRHPEAYVDDTQTPRPMSRDSMGPMIAAAYYTYTLAPDTKVGRAVKRLAHDLIGKLIDWLRPHNWMLAEASEDPGHGPDYFILSPAERYALQNVAAKMDFLTAQWNIWNGVRASVQQLIIDSGADVLSQEAGKALNYMLQHVDGGFPYDVSLDEWGRLQGKVNFTLSDDARERAVAVFQETISKDIKELGHVSNLAALQPGELIGRAVDRMLDRVLKDTTIQIPWGLHVPRGPFWKEYERSGKIAVPLPLQELRTALTSTLQQVVPWLNYPSGLAESLTMIASIELLKRSVPDTLPVVHTSFWSVLAELETRPEMGDILALPIHDFASYLGDKARIRDERSRPPFPVARNGLWDWLAENTPQVDEMLGEFRDSGPNSRKWDGYAWEEAAWEWGPGKELHSRLDFLILRALRAKGTPPPLHALFGDWTGHWSQVLSHLAGDVRAAFVEGLKGGATNAAKFLKGLGLHVKDIARIVWHAATHDVTQIAIALHAVESDVGRVAGALWQNVTGDLTELAGALSAAFNLGEVVQGLSSVVNDVGQVASAIWHSTWHGSSTFSLPDLAVALWNNWSNTPTFYLSDLASALSSFGNPVQVADALSAAAGKPETVWFGGGPSTSDLEALRKSVFGR